MQSLLIHDTCKFYDYSAKLHVIVLTSSIIETTLESVMLIISHSYPWQT